MYVHGFEGAWLDHPFWRTSFKLENERDLTAIKASGIRGVLIDVSKGIDVPKKQKEDLGTQPEKPLSPRCVMSSERHTSALRALALSLEPCSASEELDRAEAILTSSKAVITRLFSDIRERGTVSPSDFAPVVEAVAASVARNSSALISVARLRTKDEYTYVHSIAVSALLVNLGRQLGYDGDILRELGLAGLLHDIGKLAVPTKLLNKPDRLTANEFKVVRNHPERGHEVLERSGRFSGIVLDTCLHHHERVDGSGYPHRLVGDQISVFAKMAAICDVYDAISSRRAYKLAWSPSVSVASMYKWAGHFDTSILNAFIRSIGIHPVGSLVRLKSGRLAIVAENNEGDLTRPLVRIACTTAAMCSDQNWLDLNLAEIDDPILSREDPKACGFTNFDKEWGRLLRSGVPLTRAA
jgi:putative nucleotidyltransferase with HDIG domain